MPLQEPVGLPETTLRFVSIAACFTAFGQKNTRRWQLLVHEIQVYVLRFGG